jgi:hypothetical protein
LLIVGLYLEHSETSREEIVEVVFVFLHQQSAVDCHQAILAAGNYCLEVGELLLVGEIEQIYSGLFLPVETDLFEVDTLPDRGLLI